MTEKNCGNCKHAYEHDDQGYHRGFRCGMIDGRFGSASTKSAPLYVLPEFLCNLHEDKGPEKPGFVKTEIAWDNAMNWQTKGPGVGHWKCWALGDIISNGYRLVGFYFDDHMPTVAFPISVRTREKNGDPVSANKATHALWQKEE